MPYCNKTVKKTAPKNQGGYTIIKTTILYLSNQRFQYGVHAAYGFC